MKDRRVVVVVEMETNLTFRDLKDAVKLNMKYFGEVKQVQVNVINLPKTKK